MISLTTLQGGLVLAKYCRRQKGINNTCSPLSMMLLALLLCVKAFQSCRSRLCCCAPQEQTEQLHRIKVACSCACAQLVGVTADDIPTGRRRCN